MEIKGWQHGWHDRVEHAQAPASLSLTITVTTACQLYIVMGQSMHPCALQVHSSPWVKFNPDGKLPATQPHHLVPIRSKCYWP